MDADAEQQQCSNMTTQGHTSHTTSGTCKRTVLKYSQGIFMSSLLGNPIYDWRIKQILWEIYLFWFFWAYVPHIHELMLLKYIFPIQLFMTLIFLNNYYMQIIGRQIILSIRELVITKSVLIHRFAFFSLLFSLKTEIWLKCIKEMYYS